MSKRSYRPDIGRISRTAKLSRLARSHRNDTASSAVNNRFTSNGGQHNAQHENIARPWTRKKNSGFQYEICVEYGNEVNIGAMSEVCGFCSAQKWAKESAGLCCSSGKVMLREMVAPPEPLKAFFWVIIR